MIRICILCGARDATVIVLWREHDTRTADYLCTCCAELFAPCPA